MVKKTIYVLTRVVNRNITVKVFFLFPEALKKLKEEFFHSLELEGLTDEDKEDYYLDKRQAWIRGKISEYDWSITEKEITI